MQRNPCALPPAYAAALTQKLIGFKKIRERLRRLGLTHIITLVLNIVQVSERQLDLLPVLFTDGAAAAAADDIKIYEHIFYYYYVCSLADSEIDIDEATKQQFANMIQQQFMVCDLNTPTHLSLTVALALFSSRYVCPSVLTYSNG